ncbi:hypothetical protein VTG60DRAFT_3707 [Thermothelomyces hinnuleus]
MAHAPEPDPQSRILLGRGIGGNMSLLSNIMLKIPCMYWSRSISSCLVTTHSSDQQSRTSPGSRSRRQPERSISRSPRHTAGTPYWHRRRPLDTCCRRVRFDNRYVQLSREFCTGVEWKHVRLGTTHPSFMVAATRLWRCYPCDAANIVGVKKQ